MSKSLGNIVEPWEVIDRFGADALRWYFFTSKQPWDGYRFSLETIGEAVRQFLLQLWNTYGFYVLYANANGDRARPRPRPKPDRSRPLGAVAPAGDGRAGRRPARRLRRDERRARDRRPTSRSSPTGTCGARGGASGTATAAAFATLRTCLSRSRKLLAPFCPFMADEIYDNLDGEPSRASTCATSRQAGAARRRARARDGGGARDRPARSRRPRQAKSRCASRCARRSWSPTGASGRRSSGSTSWFARS